MNAEDELKKIAAEGEWDIPALAELRAGAGKLVDVMTTMIGTEWQGAAPDAAAVAFTSLRDNFVRVEQAAGALLELLRGANTSRSQAIASIDSLSSATVDPGIVAAARTASAVVFRGFTFPADGAISMIEDMLGNEREEQAQAALDDLHHDLAIYGKAVAKAAEEPARSYTTVMPGADPIQVADPPPSSYPTPRGPSDSTPSSYPTSPALTSAPVATGIGLYQPPVNIEPPVYDEDYGPPTSTPSIDAPVIGHNPNVPSLPLPTTPPGTFPGGSSDFGNGGSGSGAHGSGGLNGGAGSGGMGAGLIGGGAAAAAAAAAKSRLGGGGAGGFGKSGARVGAGGLGGAHGVGSAGSAGMGGSGSGGSGSGVGGAGGTGTAGGAGRLGSGGLLGSQGGSSAGGGNTTVATTNAAGAGGRGPGGMMGGGGGGSEDRERRGGLGGMMAPKLDDESDAAPRSAGASAGGRDQQPTD